MLLKFVTTSHLLTYLRFELHKLPNILHYIRNSDFSRLFSFLHSCNIVAFRRNRSILNFEISKQYLTMSLVFHCYKQKNGFRQIVTKIWYISEENRLVLIPILLIHTLSFRKRHITFSKANACITAIMINALAEMHTHTEEEIHTDTHSYYICTHLRIRTAYTLSLMKICCGK